MKKAYKLFVLCAVAILTMASCGQRPKGVENPKPAVYYWRTTLSLNEEERRFLSESKVGKVYLHLFDVVSPPFIPPKGEEVGRTLMPANTLLFEDSLPLGIEVIPTVFIEPGALAHSSTPSGEKSLAKLVLNRIDQMTEQNGLSTARMIQMDYDWVGSDETAYFSLLKDLRDMLHKQGRKLSATIRLHQLSKAVPPVDEGVLMVYNVGNFRDEKEENSILTAQAVAPYMPRLKDYNLPLCTALPIYGWDLLFHSHDFAQIVRGVNLADTAAFRRIDSTHYECQAYMAAPADGIGDPAGQRIYPGDIIRHEQPSIATLRQVRNMLESSRSGVCDQIVIYHLDSKFLKHKHDEIKELYD